jgi:predicted ribosomally synthesized peptide with SipW-like signal peptide
VTRIKWVVAAVALIVLAATGGGVTWAAFTATATNSGNSISSGTVAIGDNDSGAAMFSLTGMTASSTDTGCIKVTHSGSLASGVRLYGTTTGTGLDPYLSVTVTRGSFTPSDPGFDSCNNFSPDATTYLSGQSAGVVYAGTLQGFPDSYAAGIVDPTSGSPESWTTNESHVYKIEIAAGDVNAAAGKNATQSFTWEARNN